MNVFRLKVASLSAALFVSLTASALAQGIIFEPGYTGGERPTATFHIYNDGNSVLVADVTFNPLLPIPVIAGDVVIVEPTPAPGSAPHDRINWVGVLRFLQDVPVNPVNPYPSSYAHLYTGDFSTFELLSIPPVPTVYLDEYAQGGAGGSDPDATYYYTGPIGLNTYVIHIDESDENGAIPEPSSIALMCLGVAGLLAWHRRRAG